MALPRDADAQAGVVVKVGRALMAKPGVVLGSADGEVRLLVKGGEAGAVPEAEFQKLAAVEVPGPPMIGGPGRLLRAARAARDKAVKPKWTSEYVEAEAVRLAGADLGTRRATALDALALGLDQVVAAMGLSPTETAWYRARQAVERDSVPEALHWMEQLPPGAYAGRITLLARCVPALLADPAAADRARTMLKPFTADSREARLLHAALARRPDSGMAALLEDAAAPLGPTERESAAALAAAERMRTPPPRSIASVAAFNGFLTARQTRAFGDAEVLAPLPVPLLDELLDLGALTSAPAGADWRPELAAYVRCRVSPGTVPHEDLVAAGFTAELARRAYLAGDERALAALPASDPDVAHYDALLRVRTRGAIEASEPMRPKTAALLEEIREIRLRTAKGEPSTASHELAADASCRALLHESALRGLLRPPDGLGARSAFRTWLNLCEVQRSLFDEDWDSVIARGVELADRSGPGPIRDEAINMVAFARARTSDTDGGLRAIEEMTAARPSPGLLVNASVLAARTNVDRSISYLARLVPMTTRPEARRDVIARAVEIWRRSDETAYPTALRALLRTALTQPEPDEEHYRFLLDLATHQDSVWVAGFGGFHPLDESQRDAVSYYKARARLLSDPPTGDLEDIAKVLVSIRRHPWVAQEIEWLAELLNDMVHVEFGKAAFAWRPIEVLVAAKVLPLQHEIVLSAQAATHLAVMFQADRSVLKPEIERRLLLDPADAYHSRREELPEEIREGVADEIVRCLFMSGLALAEVTERDYREFADDWNELVDRQRWDGANLHAIFHQKRSIWQEMDALVTRLEAFDRAISLFPDDTRLRDWRDNASKAIRGWRNELIELGRGL